MLIFDSLVSTLIAALVGRFMSIFKTSNPGTQRSRRFMLKLFPWRSQSSQTENGPTRMISWSLLEIGYT